MSETPPKIVIKRYRNRKLYDTQNSVYVTLDDIAEMVRDHQEIQVVENDTGEDITSSTLAQILFEKEKKSHGFLTLSELNRIIRDRSQKVRDFVERNLTTEKLHFDEGLLKDFYDDVERQIQRLFKKESASPEDRERLLRRIFTAPQQNLEEFFEQIEGKIQAGFEKLTHVGGLRDEMEQMNRQLRRLERELEKLRSRTGQPTADGAQREGVEEAKRSGRGTPDDSDASAA